MNRRGFFTALGAVAVAPAIAMLPAPSVKPKAVRDITPWLTSKDADVEADQFIARYTYQTYTLGFAIAQEEIEPDELVFS